MLLALDLGNTNLKGALFSDIGRISRKRNVGISGRISPAEIRKVFGCKGVDQVRLASVVPRLNLTIQRTLEQELGCRVKVLKYTDLPVKAEVRKPSEVGIDRLLNVLAAAEFYPRPAVVLDCGTALTFDLVSREGNYAGGVIAPSPASGRDFLAEKTGLLPRIDLQTPVSVVGKSTVDCLKSGLVFGFADLISGILVRLAREWEPRFTVVGTGGGLPLLLPLLKEPVVFDADLTLKGIFLSRL